MLFLAYDVNFMDDVGQTLLNWASAFGTQEMVSLLSLISFLLDKFITWNCAFIVYILSVFLVFDLCASAIPWSVRIFERNVRLLFSFSCGAILSKFIKPTVSKSTDFHLYSFPTCADVNSNRAGMLCSLGCGCICKASSIWKVVYFLDVVQRHLALPQFSLLSKTPLMCISSAAQVEFLCERGADVNRGQRSSSLHYAACFGRPSVVKTLLLHNADSSLKDEEGKTALEKAKERNDDGHREVVKLLENPGKFSQFREVSVLQRRKRKNKAIHCS